MRIKILWRGLAGLFKVLWSFVIGDSRPSENGRAVFFAVLCALLLALTVILPPAFTRFYVDIILGNGNYDWIQKFCFCMVVTAGLLLALTWLQKRCLLRLETSLSLSSSAELFKLMLRLPIQFFGQRQAGEIAKRLGTNDKVAHALSQKLGATVLDVFTVIVVTGVLFFYDALLTVGCVGIAFINLIVLFRAGRKRTDASRRYVQEHGKLWGTATYGIRSIEDTKATGQEAEFFSRWAGLQARTLQAKQNLDEMMISIAVWPPLTTFCTSALVLFVGGHRVMEGKGFSIGLLMAYQALAVIMGRPISAFVGFGGLLQETKADLARLDDLLRYPEDLNYTKTPRVSSRFPAGFRLSGQVEFRNVSFGYSPQNPLLVSDFNLIINPGERVALVGDSGSGKSTLAKIASGLLHPEGELLFDGTRRLDIPLNVLSNSVAMVDQDILLFEGTILDNLTLWDPTVLDRKTVRACEDAEIIEMISSRQGGFAGRVEEGGVKFSGGERQRIELARALACEPSFLILDEATSALDPLVEEKILRNLQRRGCSCLIVAHRLSTIRDCDLILVMEAGRVVERGTHDEMMERENGTYRRLFESQNPATVPEDILPGLIPESTALQKESGENWTATLMRLASTADISPRAARSWPGLDETWILSEGEIDLFVADAANGRRTHIASFQSGEAIFGMEPAFSPSAKFLFVAWPGTRIAKLTRRDLKVCAAAHPQAVSQLVDGWIRHLMLAVESPASSPLAHVRLSSASAREVKMDPGQIASTAHEVLWVQIPVGQVEILALGNSFGPNGHPLHLPMCRETWFKALDPISVTAFLTSEVLSNPEFWPSLNRFHALFVECYLKSRDFTQNREMNLRKEREKFSRNEEDFSLREMAAIVENPLKKIPRWRQGGHADPWLVSCSLVGEAAGVEVMTPRKNPGEHNFVRSRAREPLEVIAKASRFRFRKVALPDHWWRHDHGPLLGKLHADGQPVALLPAGRRGYRWENPRDHVGPELEEHAQTRLKVDKDQADQLQSHAFAFYRTLPSRIMGARELFRFARFGLGWDFRTIMTAGVLLGLINLIPPFLTGYLFKSVIPQADRFQLGQMVVGLLAAALAIAVFEYTRAIAVLRVEMKMDQGVQAAVWDRLIALPLAFFRRYSSGDLTNRALGIDTMRQGLSGAGISSILGSISSIFLAGMLFAYNTELAFLALVLVAVPFFAIAFANSRQLRHQTKLLDLVGRISGLVNQLIGGVGKLRVAGAEDRAFGVWARLFAEQKRAAVKAGNAANWVAVLATVWPVVSSLCLFLLFVHLQEKAVKARQPLLNTGDFIAFFSAFSSLLSSALALGVASADLLKLIPCFRRLKPILEEVPEADEARKSPGELTGGLEVSHVTYRYPGGSLVLRDVSFHARAGEFIALVGDSGSGKSTLIRLLLGLENPETGSVRYDGQDLTEIDKHELREQIGVVMQSGSVIPTTIFENIIVDSSFSQFGGSEELAMEKAWCAAREAGLEEDIQKMPMKMMTPVNEGGTAFSGGQKQRLMIARALVKKPRLIFFDEATSALDNKTQQKVMESLNALQATRVVVAHRLNTIVDADRIYFLQKGVIRQEGTHQELMSREGPYREFVKRQL